MKRTTHLSALFLPVLLFGACTAQNSNQYIMDAVISFTSGLTKACDSGFTEGDVIGISCRLSSDWNYRDVQYKFDGSSFIPSSEEIMVSGKIYAPVFFRACYPYREDSSQEYLFTVESDQSEAEKCFVSDLRICECEAYILPSMIVRLPFRHMMATFSVYFFGDVDDIKEVYVADVYGSASAPGGWWDPTEITTAGELGIIKAYNYLEKGWSVILPPQTANPRILVVTESGGQYEFMCPEGFTLQSGEIVTSRITLGTMSSTADFTSELSSWTGNKEIDFGLDK